MFHPDYKHITEKLPLGLVNRAYQRLLHHYPLPEQISEKSERIEEYLRRTLKIYQTGDAKI